MKMWQTCGIIWLFALTSASAQNKVQVLTKTIEEQFSYSNGDVVNITGERSAIKVNTWANPEVKVILKLISKATSKAVAQEEMQYHHYVMEKRNEEIAFANYILFPKGKKKMAAMLLAEYELWMPPHASLRIINSYGNISIENKTGNTHIDSKFGNIRLQNVQGEGYYRSYYGDFAATRLGGKIRCEFSHTKSMLANISGGVRFTSLLGDLIIEDIHDLKSLVVDVEKSDVKIEMKSVELYQYDFSVGVGEIILPGNVQGNWSNKRKSWQYGKGGPVIKVRSSLGKIVLEKK